MSSSRFNASKKEPPWYASARLTGASPMKAARRWAGKTQKDLAAELSISQHYLASIENGQKSGKKIIDRIAESLGTTPEWLRAPYESKNAIPRPARSTLKVGVEYAKETYSDGSSQKVASSSVIPISLIVSYGPDTPISALPLSSRAQNALRRIGVGTVGDLQKHENVSLTELMLLPKTGVHVANEITAVLQCLNNGRKTCKEGQ